MKGHWTLACALVVGATAFAGCDGDDSITDTAVVPPPTTTSLQLTCAGQVVATISECVQLINTSIQATERFSFQTKFALEQLGVETGLTTVAEMIQRANTRTQLSSLLQANLQEARAAQAQANAAYADPAVVGSPQSRQALADYYAQRAAFYASQAEMIAQQRERDSAAFEAAYERRDEMRIEEAGRLDRELNRAIEEDARYQDEMSEMAKDAADRADALGP